LLILGIVLLLDNLGLLGDINIWGVIWPLALIALGVWILWGNFLRRSSPTEYASIPLEDIKQARILVQHGAGRLRLSSGANPAVLLEGEFGGGVEVNKQSQGDHLQVKLSLPGRIFPFVWFPGESLDWSLRVNREIPLALKFETGAGETQMDLSDLLVSELALSTGASSSSLTLPGNAGSTTVKIESGAASLDIRVPAGVAAKIRSSGGISSISVDRQRFPKAGDVYLSPDFDFAPNKVEINVQMGVGSVSIK
jgi:hypothetical protein